MRPRFPPNMWAYSTTSLKWPVIFGSQEITDHNCLSDEPSLRHCLLIIALGVKTLVLLQCWVGARICSVSVLVRAANVLTLRGPTAVLKLCMALTAAHVMLVAWWESPATDWDYPIRRGVFTYHIFIKCTRFVVYCRILDVWGRSCLCFICF